MTEPTIQHPVSEQDAAALAATEGRSYAPRNTSGDELLARATIVRKGDTLLLLMPFVPEDADNLTQMIEWVQAELDGVTVRFIAGVSGAVVQYKDHEDLARYQHELPDRMVIPAGGAAERPEFDEHALGLCSRPGCAESGS